ncbi:uncharacterized protein LOC141856584 [Brevipalpus obovatus]|uniref:uncharacterized protein LOC141856584 n=1 Tax=Brevipalpus obovatus TaxID=246614 RepID=UPI003D9E7083
MSPSVNGIEVANRAQVEGIFHIKLPANVRDKNAWKVWTRKFVRLQLLKQSKFSNDSILLTVFKTKCREIILKEKLNPNRTLIFRCSSRSKDHAFTLYSDGHPVLHLSGDSETESQHLIRSMRNLIWPPNSILELCRALETVFEVSVIDNERSTRAGLLGASGNLALSNRKVTFSCIRSGHVIQEWYLNTIDFEIVPQKHPQDRNKIVSLIGCQESSTGHGPILFFCENSLALIRQADKLRTDLNAQTLASMNDFSTMRGEDRICQSLRGLESFYQVPCRRLDLNSIGRSSRPTSSESNTSNTMDSLHSSFSRSFQCNSRTQMTGFENYDVPESTLNRSHDKRHGEGQKRELSSIESCLLDCSIDARNWINETGERLYMNLNMSCSSLDDKPKSDIKLDNDHDDDHIYEEIGTSGGDQLHESYNNYRPPLPIRRGKFLDGELSQSQNLSENEQRRSLPLANECRYDENDYEVIKPVHSITLPRRGSSN